jgi:hypothetical protein
MSKEFRISELDLKALSAQSKNIDDALKADGDPRVEVAKAVERIYDILNRVHDQPIST